MKKNLLLGFLIMFLLSATTFAVSTDSKKESEKPMVSDLRENKLSDEELSRLTRRADIDNLAKTNLSNEDKYDSKKDLKPAKQIVVNERRGGYIYYGAGTLLLIILLVLLLA